MGCTLHVLRELAKHQAWHAGLPPPWHPDMRLLDPRLDPRMDPYLGYPPLLPLRDPRGPPLPLAYHRLPPLPLSWDHLPPRDQPNWSRAHPGDREGPLSPSRRRELPMPDSPPHRRSAGDTAHRLPMPRLARASLDEEARPAKRALPLPPDTLAR